jgi:hypothetical protein
MRGHERSRRVSETLPPSRRWGRAVQRRLKGKEGWEKVQIPFHQIVFHEAFFVRKRIEKHRSKVGGASPGAQPTPHARERCRRTTGPRTLAAPRAHAHAPCVPNGAGRLPRTPSPDGPAPLLLRPDRRRQGVGDALSAACRIAPSHRSAAWRTARMMRRP